ncbi:MAG: phosphatidate cytidylyltransferase [Faecalibacterium sp.]|mgnify:CR=1 FL=1|nr:phosphatidate cytidylyltransferase [Faecalibacterium sp.]
MLKRFLTAFLLTSFVVAMLVLGVTVSYHFLDGLILFFVTLGVYEMYKCLKVGGYNPYKTPIIIVVLLAYPAWLFFKLPGLIGVFGVAFAVGLVIMTFKKDSSLNDLTTTFFAMIYPYFMLSPAFYMTENFCGIFAVAYAIFVPVMTDTMAYLVGSTMGKHKLCPTISPKKTVEGAVGGLLGGIIMSVVFYLLFEYFAVFGDKVAYIPFNEKQWASIVIYVVLGILGGVFSQLGDLAASSVKRKLGVKDFGNIFPGHGGSMDRIDSIMFMLVLLFVAFQIIY